MRVSYVLARPDGMNLEEVTRFLVDMSISGDAHDQQDAIVQAIIDRIDAGLRRPLSSSAELLEATNAFDAARARVAFRPRWGNKSTRTAQDLAAYPSGHRPVLRCTTMSVKLEIPARPEAWSIRSDTVMDMRAIANALNCKYMPKKSKSIYIYAGECRVTLFPCGTLQVWNADNEQGALFAIDVVKSALDARVPNRGMNEKLQPPDLAYDVRTRNVLSKYVYTFDEERILNLPLVKQALSRDPKLVVSYDTELHAGLIARCMKTTTIFLCYRSNIVVNTQDAQDMHTVFEESIFPRLAFVAAA